MNKYVTYISHPSISFIISIYLFLIYLYLDVPKELCFYFMFVLFTEKQNVIQLKKAQGVMNTHFLSPNT